jgi:hypothetical protein
MDYLIEYLVKNSVFHLFQGHGIDIHRAASCVKSYRPGAEMKVDLLAMNEDVIIAIDIKSKLSQQDVQDFLSRLRRFKQAFLSYADSRIYGAVAGIEIDEGIDLYAYRQGLFVIKLTGDTVALANDRNFTPVTW